MKSKLFTVTYKENPNSETIKRNIFAFSENDVKNILKYEDDITKNNLVILTIS